MNNVLLWIGQWKQTAHLGMFMNGLDLSISIQVIEIDSLTAFELIRGLNTSSP